MSAEFGGEIMNLINRGVVVIKPKEPFFNWV